MSVPPILNPPPTSLPTLPLSVKEGVSLARVFSGSGCGG